MTEFDDEIINLWPTKIFKRYLKNHHEPNRLLIQLIRQLDKGQKNITTDYNQSNFLENDNEATNWLRGSINDAVIDYLRSNLIDYSVNWSIQAWPNINRFGDYHDPHNHPHCYLSGTYYLKVPNGQEIGSRKDLRPNQITFYDPRPGVNMGSIAKDPNIDPEFTVHPEPGILMLWPAFLNHFIHPNLTKQTRISISFNIILKWSNDYLPEQSY